MNETSDRFLDVVASICEWHDRVLMTHPCRKLSDGTRQPIFPPEVPGAIRRREIVIPEELTMRVAELIQPDFGPGT